MRVALVFDMEGVSGIESFVELYPIYEEYWQRGRQKLNADIVAAALGLLDGGASHVHVMNHHGAGETEWPNLIVDALPPGASPAGEWDKEQLRDHVDAIFEVGCHARGGSASFSSHTILPGLRLRLNGELLSESHWWALAAALPVLGIVGSEALGADLGSLADVPFLAVQGGEGRLTPLPLFASQEASSTAIRAFAKSAIRTAGERQAFAPRDFVLEASLQNGDGAWPALEPAGWTRTSRTEFRLQAAAWRAAGEPVRQAIDAAIGAAWEPYAYAFKGLDATTQQASLAYPRDAFTATDAMARAWNADRTVEWTTPDAAARWEGLETGQDPSV